MSAHVPQEKKLDFDPTPVKAALGLAQTGPQGKRGRVLDFTRHPKLLARVPSMPWPAGVRFFVGALLIYSDKEGVSWVNIGGPDGIIELIPRSIRCARCAQLCMCGKPTEVTRYSLSWLRNCARQAKKLELVRWEVIEPWSRFPSRKEDGSLDWAAGKWTWHGGRVWFLNLPKLRSWSNGTDLARWSVENSWHESRTIDCAQTTGMDCAQTTLHGSVVSPTEKQKGSRAPRRAPAPLAPKAASETPRSESVADAGERRLTPEASRRARGDASPAAAGDADARAWPPESESGTRGKEHEPDRPAAPDDRKAFAEQMKRDMDSLFPDRRRRT